MPEIFPYSRLITNTAGRYRRRALPLFKRMYGQVKRVPARRSMRRFRKVIRSLYTSKLQGPRSVSENISFFANPGPAFERADSPALGHQPSRAKTVAFYLPQFHKVEQNDKWWGEGFTEWRNVSRGSPRFSGHYQPRIPRDLGFYDLSKVENIKAQSELATENGIDAFCFYYYWFNGKRLMEKPLDLFAEARDIDQEFCIMWANENWTRTWDGMENDVLIQQDYRDSDEEDFIRDTARYMAHERYLRVDGRPLFILYRPGLLPDAVNTIARWRQRWTELLGTDPVVLMVQGFGDEDPRAFKLDGAVEFPPHKVCAGLPNINHKCRILDPGFTGLVRSYEDVVNNALADNTTDYPLVKTVSPHWDNDARRQGAGMTMHGSTPALYERWLNGVIQFARQNPLLDEPIVFINAWNEWAEGAYLEPDVHYGHAYLNATRRAIKGQARANAGSGVLLVGHDAHRHGAQMLLLNIATTMTQQLGIDVTIVLKGGGVMLAEYRKITKTIVLDDAGRKELDRLLSASTFDRAVCNTTVTGDLVPMLENHGVRVVSLIHEMPHLINEFGLQANVKAISTSNATVVFPADIVKSGFQNVAGSFTATALIQPQGTYKSVSYNELMRRKIRSKHGIAPEDKVVMGVGYADLRKGFDLFVDTARRLLSQHGDVHFIWAGALSADMQRWIAQDIARHERIHLTGFVSDVEDYYSAADVLFLPSREDPYPTVVLEAMHVGMPVVTYEKATGLDALMKRFGRAVPYADAVATDAALIDLVESNTAELREQRQRYVDEECRFEDYCRFLMRLLQENRDMAPPITADSTVDTAVINEDDTGQSENTKAAA